MKRYASLSKVVIPFAVIIAVMFVTSSTTLSQSTFTGRLVFTDYPEPDHGFSVDVFDFEQGERSPLELVPYSPFEDIGVLARVDEQQMYASVCFGDYNVTNFCTAPVSDILAYEELSRFDVIHPLWQDNYYGPPLWSPDGRRVAYYIQELVGGEYQAEIYIMDADGTNLIDLTPEDEHAGLTFAWSPDGSQIAFSCKKESYLCIADNDGSHLQRFQLVENIRLRDIAWSPDGEWIAFSLLDDFRNAEIYLIQPDGSQLHRLVEAGENYHEEPVWSPDGSKLLFHSGEGRSLIGEIYVINRDGTEFRNLTERLGRSEFGGTWSPDGNNIAFFSAKSGMNMFLYAASIDGREMQRITSNFTWAAGDHAPLPEVFWLP